MGSQRPEVGSSVDSEQEQGEKNAAFPQTDHGGGEEAAGHAGGGWTCAGLVTVQSGRRFVGDGWRPSENFPVGGTEDRSRR